MTGTVTATVPAAKPSPLERLSAVLAPLTGLGLVLVLAAITTPHFYSSSVLRIVLFQIGLIGIAALGQTLVLLVGGIDLSVSGVMSLSAVVVATVTAGSDDRLLLGVLLALLAGLAVGLLNGGLVILRDVPPFVATFASFVLLQGVIIAWTGGAPSGRIPAGLSWLGGGRVGGFLPVPVIVFAVLAVIGALVLARSTAGRRLYATGLNRSAAGMSGVRTGLVVLGCYVLSALSGVLAGLVNASYIGMVDSALVGSLNLDAIAAAIIGGVALTGGRGRISQTVVGVVLLATLLTWLTQLGAEAGARLLVSGAVILLAVFLQHHPVRLPSLKKSS